MVKSGDLVAGQCAGAGSATGIDLKVFMVSRGADNPNGAAFTWNSHSDQCYSASGTYRRPDYQAAC